VLPATLTARGGIPASQLKLVLDLATPEGCKVELSWLAGYIPTWGGARGALLLSIPNPTGKITPLTTPNCLVRSPVT